MVFISSQVKHSALMLLSSFLGILLIILLFTKGVRIMGMIICDSDTRFTKFYLKNLFTNELERCTEKDFNEIVVRHRDCFELVYDGTNAQNFLIDGQIEARRERGK